MDGFEVVDVGVVVDIDGGVFEVEVCEEGDGGLGDGFEGVGRVEG